METMELHRGRLIDHIQLVVRDLVASRRFYQAVFDTIGIPIAGEGDDYFWADELFISSASSEAAAGQLTGRHHLAFQARDSATVDAFHTAAIAGGSITARRANAPTTRATTAPSCSTRTATTSKWSITVRRTTAPTR